MIIYYPQSSVLYSRQVSGTNLTETSVNIQPGNIFYFSGSGMASASWVASSSYTTTASYALNGGTGGTSVSSSWASSSISSSWASIALSSSYSKTASYAATYTSTVSVTSASWASSSLSSSFVRAPNGIQLFNITTQTYYNLSISGTVGHETLIIQ